MVIIYDLIFLIFTFIYLPIYLFKRKFHPGFKMRLGILPPGFEHHRPIWIHAVSVGEIMAARNLIKKIRIAYPDKRFFITTVTLTGNKIAKNIAGVTDFISYFPLDISFIVRSVVDKIRPSLFIVMETEIWPNLIAYLYQKKIPIILVNARISDRSFRGYLSIKFLLQPLLNKINLFCVQTQMDAQRLLRLGVVKNRIEITGNMKFDVGDYTDSKKDYTDYKLRLGLQTLEKLWIAGSTHPGEEEIILDMYKKLLSEFPRLRLLIAPRHPERAKDIEKIVIKYGFNPLKVSQFPPEADQPLAEAGSPVSACGGSACGGSQFNRQTGQPLDYARGRQANRQTVFLLDTIGQLVYFYNLADIVFVGGSLIKKGGHNILEPASLGKPIIFGPYMFNFRDIADLFLEDKAAVLARNKEELEINMRDLLNNPERRLELGQRARAVLLQNQGATRKNMEYISNYLSTQRWGGI